jgi:hypothetical protein
MDRRTRREHFSSAALSITDDLLHRNILLLRARIGHFPSGQDGGGLTLTGRRTVNYLPFRVAPACYRLKIEK